MRTLDGSVEREAWVTIRIYEFGIGYGGGKGCLEYN